MKVLKFGGSSVGTKERIQSVCEIVSNSFDQNGHIAVIFSAYQGATDRLIKMSQLAAMGDDSYKTYFSEFENRHIETADSLLSVQKRGSVLTHIKILLNDLEELLYGIYLIKEITPKTLDYVMSFGERLSAYTISAVLNDMDKVNTFIDSRDIIKSDGSFGRAMVDFELTYANIRDKLLQPAIYIVTGFIASTQKDETTTLGRGGSDFSASIFGAALNASEIEIWTDVDGVLTADPRKVKTAFPVAQMTYEEAMELSHFGAKVIHPPTMQPALDKNIPIRIKNSFNPQLTGTLISAEKKTNGKLIRGISSIDNVSLLQIQGSGMVGMRGIAQRIFSALAQNDINVIMISQASSEHSICLAIQPEAAQKAEQALKEELKYELHYGQVNEILIEPDMCIIAVVGENMRHMKGIAGRVFQTLGDHGINISAIAQGSSELNISMVIARNDEEAALNTLHDAFFSEIVNEVKIYLAGTGGIGNALLEQIHKQEAWLSDHKGSALQVRGIANSKIMLIPENPIDLKAWGQSLKKSDQSNVDNIFIKEVLKGSSHNKIFVDCTASEGVSSWYSELLESGIAVVTANKIANSGKQSQYNLLKDAASSQSAPFLYETNAGAALPVIKTIRELVDVGDKIQRIEAVLSGTLSYLFNSFDGSQPFSKLVRSAQEQGYTEPDPRADLSGLDVARKLLILIRESGRAFEMKDILIEGLLPAGAEKAVDLNAFYKLLEESDNEMEEYFQSANANGLKLCYIASYDGKEASIGLNKIDNHHPFFGLKGSDNIVSIYTDLYKDTPLVIRGPGAGTEITAAGVFTDILRAAKILI